MSMKLIGNRNNPCCIHEMQWSNKMDLIALVSETGEHIFYLIQIIDGIQGSAKLNTQA